MHGVHCEHLPVLLPLLLLLLLLPLPGYAPSSSGVAERGYVALGLTGGKTELIVGNREGGKGGEGGVRRQAMGTAFKRRRGEE